VLKLEIIEKSVEYIELNNVINSVQNANSPCFEEVMLQQFSAKSLNKVKESLIQAS